MKRIVLLAALCAALGFAWGAATIAFRIFPFFQIKSLVPEEQSPIQMEMQKLFEMYPRKGDIVVVGDSILNEINWQDAIPEFVVVQRTIGGSTSQHIVDRISSIKAADASTTVLMIGTNDIGRGVPLDDTLKNISIIRKQLGGRLIVLSIPPCTNKNIRCPMRTPNIAKFNERLSTMPGIDFVDLRGVVGPDDILDGTHLKAVGINKLVGEIRRALGSAIAK